MDPLREGESEYVQSVSQSVSRKRRKSQLFLREDFCPSTERERIHSIEHSN